MKRLLVTLSVLVGFVINSTAQQSTFSEASFKKVDRAQRAVFQKRFEKAKWTGAGLDKPTVMDQIPTNELRSRLQSLFGEPTQKLEDLLDKKDFRPANFVQFEYWFTVNDSIPLMILDVDGPLAKGLVYGGESKYVDLMPEIKRTLAKKLMDVKTLSDFKDLYYDLENSIWYDVRYEGGVFSNKKIPKPSGIKVVIDR